MSSLFTLLSNVDKVYVSLIVVASALVSALIFTFITSLKMRGTKSYFITSSLLPVVVAAIVSMVSIFLDDATTGVVRIVTISVALGLIRFRSYNGRAEEMLLLFCGVAIGLISGLGFVVFALIFAVVVALLFLGLSSINLFSGKKFNGEKMLRITVPESLEYDEVLADTFKRFLKQHEMIEIRTTAMGSMFRLSYRIEMIDSKQEKAFIDELRTKNSNLEISIIPFLGNERSL
ncbi:MAG: hypothetical protein GX813_00765 [Erysipelotrichia bacterium]|nr:hypothetical protein [Erysipelotrichia bacterium]